MSSITLQPLDLLKTRLQQEHGTSVWQAIKELKSVSQLWRGTLPSAMRTSIGSALYLSMLNLMRTFIAQRDNSLSDVPAVFSHSSKLPQLSIQANLITGAVARGTVGYLTMPITVLKVRFESTNYNYSSLTQATKDIIQKEGFTGFFRGYGSTCLRDAPYSGLYVLLYEKFKQWIPLWIIPNSLKQYNHDGTFATPLATFINSSSAMCSASLATIATAPFDTIKTRIQLQPLKFRNLYQTFCHIIKHESPSKLFSGLSLRLTRKAFSAGIAWGIYEELIKRFM